MTRAAAAPLLEPETAALLQRAADTVEVLADFASVAADRAGLSPEATDFQCVKFLAGAALQALIEVRDRVA